MRRQANIKKETLVMKKTELHGYSNAASPSQSEYDAESMAAHKSVHEFTVKDKEGQSVSLDKYKGHVLIIVNVASECGLTNSNYKELKTLHDEYHERGLRVAAFPCNQFGGQEPKCELDITNFVKEKFSYEPELYAKVNVNGEEADPLWKFLKTEQGGFLVDAIKWNFTKFLVDKNGKVVERFAPTTSPLSMKSAIEKLL